MDDIYCSCDAFNDHPVKIQLSFHVSESPAIFTGKAKK